MNSLTKQDPIHLVQITDTHLYGKPTGTLLKMNTHDSLALVIELVQEKEDRIDYVLATGDIAQDASPEAYEHFINAMSAIDAPFSWIPGNHDKPGVMQEIGAAGGYNEKIVAINNWLIIFLDSSVKNQVHGKLANKELKFLAEALDEAENNVVVDHCLVCLHHNPVKGNSGWMKDIGLHNGKEFFATVKKSKKLRAVVYGHVHQDLDFEYSGIRCLCTPSTCIQFKPEVTNFALDDVNPGYRTFRLHANGEIETQVFRVEGHEFEADFTSDGY